MSDKTLSFPGFPRAVRPVPDPLGLYFRAVRNDQVDLLNLIAAGAPTSNGRTKSWPGELINTESALILCGLLSVSMCALPHPGRSPIGRRHGPRETPRCDRRHCPSGRTQIY